MDDPHHRHASEVSAHIVNLLASDHPGGKAELFGKVLFCILKGMKAANSELFERRQTPSDN